MTTSEQHDDTLPLGVGKLGAVSLDCTDPDELADFYSGLLGMRRVLTTPDHGVVVLSDGVANVALMRAESHVRSTWPEPGQAQQIHLDVSVTDLPTAVESAVALGAHEARHQPAPDLWRVLIDPAGHPFCLTTVTGD